MKRLPVNYVIVGLLIFLSIGKVSDWMYPDEHITPGDIKRIIHLKESIAREKDLENKFNEIIKRDEIIEKSINVDSIILWDSARKYRDSIRAAINPS